MTQCIRYVTWVLASLLVFGCSKPSEEVGKEIAAQMKAPIDEAQAVADQIGKLRAAEADLPK